MAEDVHADEVTHWRATHTPRELAWLERQWWYDEYADGDVLTLPDGRLAVRIPCNRRTRGMDG